MERLPAVSLCRFGFEVVPDADVARALDAQVVDARRDDLALAGVNEDAHERCGKGADQHADEDAERRTGQPGAADALADALALPCPVVLGHVGGKGVAEILHRHVGEGIDLDRRRKGRHDDDAEAVHKALHHQDAEVHDGLLDAGHNGQIQDGSSKLYDGSKELGDGITKLEDGSDTLATSLNDGAKEVKETKKVEEHFIDLLYDPQTSGGLLLSVEPQYVEAVMEEFEKKHLDTKVSIIGTVTEKSDKLIRLH